MAEWVEIGDARLARGDCLGILPQLEAESIDLTVTSPPYDNLRTYEGQLKKYFDIACERIERAQAQGKLFEPEPPKAEQMKLDNS